MEEKIILVTHRSQAPPCKRKQSDLKTAVTRESESVVHHRAVAVFNATARWRHGGNKPQRQEGSFITAQSLRGVQRTVAYRTYHYLFRIYTPDVCDNGFVSESLYEISIKAAALLLTGSIFSPSLRSQPSLSGLKKVCVRSLPSSSGILKGSFLMLS